MRGGDIVFLYLWYFVVVSRGFFLLSCWFWQFVTGCFWELHILKRARTPVWALKALIWACQCESESWTPGNYCWLSWSDPDSESQRLWLGWSLWIFGWLNIDISWSWSVAFHFNFAVCFSYLFLSLSDPCFEVFLWLYCLIFCGNNAVFAIFWTFRFSILIK